MLRRAPGLALSDFNIFQLIAQAWGCADQFSRWKSPEASFQLLKQITADQPCEFTGITDYQMIDAAGGIQWPFTATTELQTERRLFADGQFFTPDGRARILFSAPTAMPEPPDAEYPFLLLTGRGTSSQWHTNTRTGKSDVLRKLYPAECYAEIHPADAERLGILPHSSVTVSSRRGSLTANAFLTPTVQPGQVFIPMHYRAVNQLTFPAFDPHSRQPSYKACAIRIQAAK